MSTSLLISAVRTVALTASMGAHAVAFVLLAQPVANASAAPATAAAAVVPMDVEMVVETVPAIEEAVVKEAPDASTKDAPRNTHPTIGAAAPATHIEATTANVNANATPETTAAPAVTAPDDAPVHFTLAATSAVIAAAAPVASGTGTAASGAGEGDETFAAAAVDAPARLVSSAPAVYPAAARAEQIECDVPVDIVVDTHGSVISARSASHAGFGLDEAAAQAIRGYRFSPASRGGRPVRVRMRWTVQFRLR